MLRGLERGRLPGREAQEAPSPGGSGRYLTAAAPQLHGPQAATGTRGPAPAAAGPSPDPRLLVPLRAASPRHGVPPAPPSFGARGTAGSVLTAAAGAGGSGSGSPLAAARSGLPEESSQGEGAGPGLGGSPESGLSSPESPRFLMSGRSGTSRKLSRPTMAEPSEPPCPTSEPVAPLPAPGREVPGRHRGAWPAHGAGLLRSPAPA